MCEMHQVRQCHLPKSTEDNPGNPGKSPNEDAIVQQRRTPSTTNDSLLASAQAHEMTLVKMTAAVGPTAWAVLGVSQILQQG